MALGPIRGIKYGVEATYGADPSTFIALHARGSTLGIRRRNAKTGAGLGLGAGATSAMPAYVDGEITFGWNFAEATVGELLQAMCIPTSTTYSLGLGGYPTNPSLGVNVNYGGLTTATTEYAFRGLIPTKLRLEWRPDSDILATVGLAGISEAAVSAPADPSPPAATTLVLPSAYGVLSLASTEVTYKRVVYECAIGHEFVGLDDIGAATARRAIWSGQWTHSLTVDFDYDDATGSDTKSLIADLIGTSTPGQVATVALGTNKLVCGNWHITGDHPVLKSGNIPMSLTGSVTTAAITTA